jgi:hypothetical protein
MHAWIRAGFALLFATVTAIASATGMPGVGTWESTLQPRDIDHDGSIDAYYDTALNITWLDLELPGSTPLNWYSASSTAATFSIFGVTGWRLPRTYDDINVGGPGPDFGYYNTDAGYNVNPNTSELAFLFHITLGNSSEWDANGTFHNEFGLNNTGPFRFLRTGSWSETIVQPGPNHPYDTSYAWGFDIEDGFQNVYNRSGALMYWQLVRDGDIASAVPEPSTNLLLALGLITLGAKARNRRGREGA